MKLMIRRVMSFINKVKNQSHLYSFVIDSNDNVFSHYHEGVIEKDSWPRNYDKKIFIFTLTSNGRSVKKKFERRRLKHTYTGIWSGKDCFYCGHKHSTCHTVLQLGTANCFVEKEQIENMFEGVEANTLTGGETFTTTRIIVIQMKR